jgi:hypothetical protein
LLDQLLPFGVQAARKAATSSRMVLFSDRPGQRILRGHPSVSSSAGASVLEQADGIAGDKVRADSVPARADRIEDDQLVEPQRPTFSSGICSFVKDTYG